MTILQTSKPQIINKLFNASFGHVNSFIALFLAASFVVRFLLLCVSFKFVNASIFSLLKVFAGGLCYDFITALYFTIVLVVLSIILPQKYQRTKVHKYLTYLLYAILSFILIFGSIAEWFFWEEFQVRMNFIAVDYLVYTTELVRNIIESYPMYAIIPALVLLAASFVFICRKSIEESLRNTEKFLNRLKRGSLYLLLPLLFFFTVQGSWESLSENKYNNELAKNGIYSFFEAYFSNEINYNSFYLTQSNETNFRILRKLLASPNSFFIKDDSLSITRNIVTDAPEQKLNVMMITVESLSADYLSYFGSTENITPNLDSLAKLGVFCENYFATGTRTVRGIEALTLSVPPTPGSSIVRRNDNDNLFSIGSVLQNRNYDLEFIYGGVGFFDNMNYFFSHNGFKICDKNSFAKEEETFSNAWGLCDEDLFNKALKEADKSYKSGKNFYYFLITTSNHRPYTFPLGKVNLPQCRIGAVKYTDFAIGQFIKMAEKKPWFAKTIFVISADHCASSAGKTDLPIDKYRIPLIIYSPKNVEKKIITTVVSQIDVAPTILGLMNLNYKSKFFGKDMLKMQPEEGRAFISSYQKIGYVKDNKIVVLDVKKAVKSYNYSPQSLIMEINNNPSECNEYAKEAIAFYQSAFFLFKSGKMKK